MRRVPTKQKRRTDTVTKAALQESPPPSLSFGCKPPTIGCVLTDPIISFTATATTIKPGTKITLKWVVDDKVARAFIQESDTNVYRLVYRGGSGAPANGSVSYAPKENTLYTLMAGVGLDKCYGREMIYIQMTGLPPKIIVHRPKR